MKTNINSIYEILKLKAWFNSQLNLLFNIQSIQKISIKMKCN